MVPLHFERIERPDLCRLGWPDMKARIPRSIITGITMDGDLLREASIRAWTAFCALAILGGAMMIAADGDNPLHSDDPYIVGFVFGGIGAVLSAAYSWLAAGRNSPRSADAKFVVILLGWCGFLLVMAFLTRNISDGVDEIYQMLVAASLLCGGVAWPLSRFQLPAWLIITLTVCGLAFFGMYVVVARQLAAR